ncbi:signal peptide peptidase SppA [Deminuibacter soli]|uniref:Signal peptide peptidase SppA n=1 Tax=Deminuibacter soli TaxID=2291815 RepID=A0A3E1NGY7_9BACT|nr:signal peptide peptidase SppA [Deminuibacter soli]RFM27203.1 signal peptide peptidase SppA [Deminuibacter soli]
MKSFFKIFFATLLALVLFTVIAFLVLAYMVGKATSPDKPEIGTNGVLVLDLSTGFKEQSQDNPLSALFSDAEDAPGLHDVVRMIEYAKTDSAVKGIYLKASGNGNGFAASEELRQALLHFRESKKFVIAYGEVMSQKAYYVATAADKVYCHPNGGVDWSGYSSSVMFLKGLLDKLEIEPQVFFAGKFKSATEPFRVTQMTDANRLQTTVLLNDLYSRLLLNTATARHTDTAALHALANNGTIQSASDALKYNLVDGLKYDDQVKAEIFRLLHIKETEHPNFILPGKYVKSIDTSDEKDKIALIYAQGDIVDGKGQEDEIGSDQYKNIIRKARFDKSVKAIVFRVNSPGGSALASDVIWREISLARKEKPVIVSMGDLAASGGYYISCNGDSVFADPGTLTGSIGVFSIIPNMQSFFKNKLGITFDRVKTAPYAGITDASKPLTEIEKHFLQADVDSIYYTFKSRVAEGRKKSIDYIDSIAQGRVWTGERAIEVGLVDRIGTMQDAIASAAHMAKLKNYSTAEYPEKKSLLEQLLGGSVSQTIRVNMAKEEIGATDYQMLQQVKKVKTWFGIPQTRMAFDLNVE